MPICLRVWEGADSREALSRETNTRRKGGKKGFLSREPFPSASRFSVEETFIVPTKLLYLSIGKTKASYFVSIPVFSSVTSHSVSFSLFFLFPSFLPSLFFFSPHQPSSPVEPLLRATRSPILAIFAQLIRLGRVELLYTEAGVVYFVSVDRLPRDNSRFSRGRSERVLLYYFSNAKMELVI